MRRVLKVIAVAMLASLPVLVTLSAPSSASSESRTRFLGTTLVGVEEVPGPGDPDGSGLAGLAIKAKHGRLCYALAVRDIEPAAAAHIHRGPAGVAGPVVVGLEAPTDGFSADCIDVDPALLREIATTPEQFYVNVHNAEFPSGALRGQLGD